MSKNNRYPSLKNAYIKENFFVSYAVRGSMGDKEQGLRVGMPTNRPIDSAVNEPSPLNTRWQYEKPGVGINSIL
jgi:hypothetical protein